VSTQCVPYQRVQICGTRGRIEIQIPFNAPQGGAMRILLDDGTSLDGASIATETLPACDEYTLQGEAFPRAVRAAIEPPYRPEDETPLKGDGVRAAHPKGPESKQASDASAQERTGSLLATEKRTLEMVANGASLSEVLNDLCAAIDAQAPAATSMVCLMDMD